MKCPRCQSVITATPDASGSIVCPGCGARLRSRSAAGAPAPGPRAAAAAAAPKAAPTPADDVDSLLGRLDAEAQGRFPDGRNPNATLPPGTPLPRIPRPPADPRTTPLNDTPSPTREAVARPTLRTTTAAAAPAPAEDPAATTRLLETILRELKAVREGQEEILSRLGRSREEPASDGPPSLGLHFDDTPAATPPPVRARRRKTVLLVDDDQATLAAARAALDAAEVPVRTATDGNAALSAIAEEKPDVIVMELDMRGSMAGKDVINMIKATMEWVDLPIVLYTRTPIESQKEARTVHGADEFVLKQAGPEALVARVITVFRKP